MKKIFGYDIQKIINNHNIIKTLRYKLNIFDIKNINENNKLEIPYKNQKYDKIINQKLINLLNIKRCKMDKLMIYFDVWFEKTYLIENNIKKSKKNKKIRKKSNNKYNTLLKLFENFEKRNNINNYKNSFKK